MKMLRILTALLSLLAGTAFEPLDVQEGELDTGPAGTPRLVEREETGWGIEGDGFYVWDEDRREAEEWAIELAGPLYPPRSGRNA